MNHKEEMDKRINKLISNVKNTEAELKDAASLTEDIMGAIADYEDRGPIITSHKGIFGHVMFKRFVATAAIVLFSIFAYEQYIILDKLNRLELSRQNTPEQTGWELRTVMKYQQLRAGSKPLLNIVESLRNEQGSRPGILKRYFQHKSQSTIKARTKIGIHKKSMP